MKCEYCKQQVGFLKWYHEECKVSAEKTLRQIENVLNQHKSDETVSKEVTLELREIVLSNALYKNYLESKIIDKTAIHVNEVVICVESGVKISETKNRCKMVETGYRYEKMPTWSEKQLLLDNTGIVIFTDKAIYLYAGMKTMRYPYNKIVNYGYEKIWTLKYAYFDVKTTSPLPHRFSFTDYFKNKNAEKEQNIALLLHCLV